MLPYVDYRVEGPLEYNISYRPEEEIGNSEAWEALQ